MSAPCPGCTKSPLASTPLDTVVCVKGAAGRHKSGTAAAAAVVKKRPATTATLTSALDAVDSDDVDALLAAATRTDRRCAAAAAGCKASTAVLGQTCPYCRRAFCLAHHVAEAHGCGDEARRQARAQIGREGVVLPGSGRPSHRPDPARRARLESKLAGRLDELASQRARKRTDAADKKRK